MHARHLLMFIRNWISICSMPPQPINACKTTSSGHTRNYLTDNIFLCICHNFSSNARPGCSKLLQPSPWIHCTPGDPKCVQLVTCQRIWPASRQCSYPLLPTKVDDSMAYATVDVPSHPDTQKFPPMRWANERTT